MHAHERRRFRIDRAAHERDMHGAIDVILERDQAERTELRLDSVSAMTLDRLLGPQPVLDQIGDRADLQLVALRELHEIVAARHRAVVVQDLDDHGRGLEAGEPREIAAGLRMASAREHAARLRHQRENVPGLTQVARAAHRAATAAWIVRARSCAEMPVVTPSAASIEIVKFVVWRRRYC